MYLYSHEHFSALNHLHPDFDHSPYLNSPQSFINFSINNNLLENAIQIFVGLRLVGFDLCLCRACRERYVKSLFVLQLLLETTERYRAKAQCVSGAVEKRAEVQPEGGFVVYASYIRSLFSPDEEKE